MSDHKTWGAAALFLCAGFGLVEAQERPDPETVVVTVGETEITAGHLALMRSQLPQQLQGYPDNVLFDGLVRQAIQQVLLAEAAGAPSAVAEMALENDRRAVLSNEEMERIAAAAASEEDLQAAYDAAFAEAEPQREFNASHILVETEDEAAEIVAELEEGADFAALARQRSTGPSGPNGGDLGWFARGAMVPAFEEAVLGLEPGEISAPVQTQFGWHVIRLDETRLQEVPTLDEARQELTAQLQREAIEERLAALEAEAEVSERGLDEIDPGFLSDPEFLQQ